MRCSLAGREAAGRLSWSFPRWFLPLWAVGVGWQWKKLCLRELEIAHGGVGGPHAQWAALAGTAARFAGFLLESGAYVLLWGGLGHRLRFWRFASWLLSISMLEVVAESMRLDLVERRAGGGTWDAILLGPGVLHGHGLARGPLAAFGALGITTALRILWTARLQAEDLGLRIGWTLAATVLVWTLSRGVLWLAAELLAGRSAG